MVISHDRAFVDNITNRTIEVTMGRIYDYKAKYSDYLVLRQDRRIHQTKKRTMSNRNLLQKIKLLLNDSKEHILRLSKCNRVLEC